MADSNPRFQGRGGANIREIESSTGARVRIDRDRHRGYGGGGGDVRVVIHGSASEQRAAKDKVDELSGIRRSGSGGLFFCRFSARCVIRFFQFFRGSVGVWFVCGCG